MMDRLIEKFKNYRKGKYLGLSYQHQYAFVGIGSHSLQNLYPVIQYLGIPLKYIVTRSKENAARVDKRFPGITGTNELDKVLNDNGVKGIFICANPKAHYQLVKKALENDKWVFVEKPPCTSSKELSELIGAESKSKGSCLVGLQKRYAPVYNILKKNAKDPVYYTGKYLTGGYPEGDPVLDLFIHPLDLIHYLFGPARIKAKNIIDKPQYTCLLQLEHENGTAGQLELSTAYSWNTAREEFMINTKTGIYQSLNTEKLTFTSKPKAFAGIPLEKVIKEPPRQEIVFEASGFTPVMEQNPVFYQGYFNEVQAFVKACEANHKSNASTLSALTGTYQLMESINPLS